MGLTLLDGLNRRHVSRLMTYYGNSKEAWETHPRDIGKTLELEAERVARIEKSKKSIDLDECVEKLAMLGISVIERKNFPNLLSEIYDPPTLLYIKGNQELISSENSQRNLAVVGTRKISAYGNGVLKLILPGLIEAGLTVVSGLAQGVDAKAHRICLENGGHTIAVLGSGLDVIYPSCNKALAEEIAVKGLLISEFFPGTLPKKYHFPLRNRIISGLSRGVLVIEAPQKSGALITAMQALDENREVFAVPGNITSPNSQGCNSLLADGAKLVSGVDEILTEIDFPCRIHRQEQDEAHLFAKRKAHLNAEEKALLIKIPFSHEITIDELMEGKKEIDNKTLHSLLVTLELDGWILRRPGGYLLRLK